MGKSKSDSDKNPPPQSPCSPKATSCCGTQSTQSEPSDPEGCPIAWFEHDGEHCLEYAKKKKAEGAKIIGIMCEYTPRELIMAAGGVPVCLCGGSAEMVEPAEEYLPSNLCPIIKSTFGYSLTHANPFLEMADLLVAETTCDGKKKMYELLEQRHSMHVLELPQKPDDDAALKHWITELRRLKSRFEDQFCTSITDEKLRSAIQAVNNERSLRRQVAALMQDENPPLSGLELLQMRSSISCMPEDLRQYQRAIEMLPSRQLEPTTQQAVRVLFTGVPLPRGAELVMKIIEENGGLVVCQENCTGLKPLLEDVDENAPDPIRALAQKYYHLPCSVMTHNRARLEMLPKLAQDYHADCVIELIWQACLTYSVEAAHVKELAARQGLPYLQIETDYSPSDSARIALRVQALFETVRGQAGK